MKRNKLHKINIFLPRMTSSLVQAYRLASIIN